MARRQWNNGQVATLTKAVNPNMAQMALQPNAQADAGVRAFPLLDAINAATGEIVANGGLGGGGGFQALPRDPRDDNAFGPMDPLTPDAIDLLDSDGQVKPRSWQYTVGWNLPGSGQRETPWQVLRAAAAGVGIIRRCIEVRKKDVRTLKFAFSPSEDAINDAYLENPGAGRLDAEQRLRDELLPEMKRMREFWLRPWRSKSWDFQRWANAAMEEILVIDGVPVYPNRTYGGDVYDLEIIDPTTIKPLLDVRGNQPVAPFPAFQQILYGFPRGEWAASTEIDHDELGNEVEVIRNGFGSAEMLYYVSNTRTYSPYGMSPVEMCLFDSRLYLQRQKWMIAEYDDGSTPLTWVETAAPTDGQQMTLAQQRLWEKALNAKLAGNTRERARVKVLPNGWKAMQMTSVDERYKPEYDLYLIKLLASYFGVTATRLGFGESNGLGGSGFHEGQMEVSGELGLRPDTEILTAIINEASCKFLGMDPRIKGMFVDPAEANTAEQAAVIVGKVNSAQISINEARQTQGQSLLPFEEANMPFILGGPNGIIFLEGAKASIEAAEAQKQIQAETQALGTAGKLGLEEKKLEDGQAAREEDREFQRETREADAELEVKKAAEIDAFRRWRRKHGDSPRRPFLFKSVEPDDGWGELENLGPELVDYEGWEWISGEDIEKAAKAKGKSPFDYLEWNVRNPLHPKGPNGRWVKRGSDLHTALVAEGERHARVNAPKTGVMSGESTSLQGMQSREKTRQDIMEAYGKWVEPHNDLVSLVKIRASVPHVEHDELSATLKEMDRERLIQLDPDPNQKALPREARAAAVKLGGEDKHFMSVIGAPSRPKTADELQDAARERLAIADAARARALALARIEEAVTNETDAESLKRMMRQAAGTSGLLDDPDFATWENTPFDEVPAKIEELAAKLGFERLGDVKHYDPALHESISPELRKGERAALVRPGYAMQLEGKRAILHKPKVEEDYGPPPPKPATSNEPQHIQLMLDYLNGVERFGGYPVKSYLLTEANRHSLEHSFTPEQQDRMLHELRQLASKTDGGERSRVDRAIKDLTEIKNAREERDLRARQSAEWKAWALGMGGTDDKPGPVRPITAYTIQASETGTGKEKLGMILPERNANVVRIGRKVHLLDSTTDETLFTGSSMPDLYRQVSVHYGAMVRHEHEGTHKVTRYGTSGDPLSSPAAQGHGYERPAERPPMNIFTGEGFAEWKADAEAYIAANTPKPITDVRGRIWDHKDRGLFVLRGGGSAMTADQIAEVKPLDIDAARKELAELEAFKASDVPLWKPTPIGEKIKEPTKEEEANIKAHQFANARIEILRRDIAHHEATNPSAGIDPSSFVTSKVNAHSLRRGDMVVVDGVSGHVVAHHEAGSVVTITLDDGRVLHRTLNEPLDRVHGGNLRKAADVGPGGADPKDQEPVTAPPPDQAWPGWLMDTIIASLIAQQLMAAMTSGLGISVLLHSFLDWAGHWRTGDPVPDVGAWLREAAPSDPLQAIVDAITPPIRAAHLEGAFVGQRSAQAVLEYVADGGDLSGDRDPALTLSVNWSDWEPGHPEAARALLDPNGLERLLYQSNVIIKGIASNRLDQVGRILGEGLARGDAPATIGRALRELGKDPIWAHMTALTETNRAQSWAAVQSYIDAGLKYKGWMTAFDQRVCKLCDHNAHEAPGVPRIVPINELFPSGDPWPPGHPRCRCAPIPILADQLAARGLGGNIR